MNLQKISKKILIIFMILQPLFDLKILFSDSIINIFKFSPATIVRMIFLLFLGIAAFFMQKEKIPKKSLIGFIVIYALYSVVHLYNGYIFDIPVTTYGNYSIFSEAFYLIRMICPILLVFITYYNKLQEKDVKKIVVTVYLIFSSVMVITNLLGVALTAYPVTDRSTIVGNFLNWFKPGIYERYSYEYLTSKGLFSYANPLSALLVGMLPILIYIVLTEKFKVINIITLFLTILSCCMLGTRIAGDGMFIVIFVSIIMYGFFKIISKDKKILTKNLICCFIFLALFILIYRYLPVANRIYADSQSDSVEESIKTNKSDQKLDKIKNKIKELENSADKEEIKNLKIKFLEENYAIYGFNSYFIEEAYPYKEDPDFWFSMLDVPYIERSDNRELKSFITKRVFELNNNKLDYLVGFSFERPMGADIYMENDIITQFYSLGVLGIILFIVPYLAITIYCFVKIIQDKKKFNYLNITYIATICLIYFIAILSGNVFDQWIVTLFLGFVTGALLTNVLKK